MKIAPLKVSDPWYSRVLSDGRVETESLRGVPIESTVEMELVELLHGDAGENYRPYLHLRGELTQAVPAVELPYGVSELALRRGSGLEVDAFYDFSPRQLAELVEKGYFTDQFRVPEEMSGIPWELPGAADFLVVAPEFSDQPPLVFMHLHEQNALELDEENSGYDLAAYFPEYRPQSQVQVEAAQATQAPAYGGSGLDVFSDVEFETTPQRPLTPSPAVTSGTEANPEALPVVPSGIFERLMSEIDARRVPEPVATVNAEAEPEVPEIEEIVPGSPAELYFARVSPGVDRVLRGEQAEAEDPLAEVMPEERAEPAGEHGRDHHAAPAAEGDFLDLSDPEPELVPLAVQSGLIEPDPEDHRKAAILRAARIRSELIGEGATTTDTEAQPGL